MTTCSVGSDKAVLQNWSRVWTAIRQHLMPATLELDFTCDVVDVETGKLALRPFLTEESPYMAKCNIRLARSKNEALRQLAQVAVQRIVCPKMLRNTFRHGRSKHGAPNNNSITFVDLPAEIRLLILGYTDLVAPENEIEWSSYRGWYIRRGSGGNNEAFCCLVHLHPIAEDKSDTSDDAHLPAYKKDNYTRQYCREKLGGRGCFCKSRHTVYSSYSESSCWAPPTPLFLVNSIVRRDALKVFFSRNRIVVWPSESLDHAWERRHSRSHISSFLSEVVPKDALRHLRYLEVVFSEHLKGDELVEWKRTIEGIKPHLVSSSLALKIFFAAGPPDPLHNYYELSRDEEEEEGKEEGEEEKEEEGGASQEEFLESRRHYVNTVLPLQHLRNHLKHLWISVFELPEERSEESVWADCSRELEHTIMGPSYKPPTSDDYKLNGLPKPLFLRTGRWYSDHDCTCFY
ncbi:uncharacterized protein K489DRAFT_142132 [Dissoconium aciculare CBS 342.82]|uniref:Uncharacterized protein n=1 Tax=Dissoconium aciculare CBS 342.82 TaxID=1314786 RepID=A0A6J3MAD3_9PEZI|nr:uncharacterized protein K489DRAFT_142132 [Dissoconium aciculare CBS 342.82]KAF1824813.1 hypothetical protein K489DRAFT_142132 [Dissoconium aciculare CBS 342.82]